MRTPTGIIVRAWTMQSLELELVHQPWWRRLVGRPHRENIRVATP